MRDLSYTAMRLSRHDRSLYAIYMAAEDWAVIEWRKAVEEEVRKLATNLVAEYEGERNGQT